MSEWRKVPFRELLENPVRNGIYKKKEFHGRGTKIVNMGELFAYPRLQDVPMKRVELNESEKARFLLKDGDLIFARRSLTAEGAGKCSVVHTVLEDTAFESSIIRARPDKAKASAEFLYYHFNSPYGKYLLRTILRQVAVAGITGTDLMELELRVPSLESQIAIAAVLSSLDDKIDLLQCQNKTLEALAQTLFRHWFVDGAEDYVELTEVVEINPKLSLKKGTLAPYLEMKNVQTNSCAPIDWYDRDFKSGTRFQNGDTLMARITPCLENNKVTYVNFLAGDEVGWGSTEFIVLRAKKNLPSFYTYLLAKDTDFRSFAIGMMTGSSGRQRVQTAALFDYELGVPSEENLEIFREQVTSIEQKLKANSIQIHTLEKLRDTLLPKLMSGEVRVRF